MSAQIRIKLGGYQGPDSVHTQGLNTLRDALIRELGDTVDIELHPNVGVAGHKTADLPVLTERGEFDGCYVSSSYLAARVPALAAFEMPFAAPDRNKAFELLDGELGARFEAEIGKNTDLVLLGIWDNGLRHISTRDRPLRHPSDASGLVLRTLPNADHQNVFRALGFDPHVIDAKDLHAAVANEKVDAQENPLTNTLNFDLHKTLPVVTLTEHLMGIVLVLFNRERFLSWPENVRRAVKLAVSEATQAQRDLSLSDARECAQKLLNEGAELIKLTAEQKADWLRAAQPEVDNIRSRLDPGLLDLIDAASHSDARFCA